MAEETLKIRVDVQTATLGELRTALKSINQEMQIASREQLPALREESKNLSEEIRKLTGRGESLTQITKESRQEARLFNFAILELAHAFRGLGDILGVVTGASEETKQGIKDMTSTLQESVGAGLGASFALKAFGGDAAALAGPVGLAVGASTALFGAIAKINEEFNRNQENLRKESEKLNDLKLAAAGLEKELGIITHEKYLEILAKNAENLRATAEETKTTVGELNLLSAVLSGLIGTAAYENAVKIHDVKKSELQTQQEVNKTLEADKKTQDEILKSSKENAEALRRQDEERDKDLQFRLSIARAIEDSTKVTIGYMEMHKNATLINVPALKQADDLMKKIKQDIRDLSDAVNEVASVFTDAFMNMGNSLNHYVIEKLGLATSVFQKFVADILEGIMRIVERMAAFSLVKGLFSILGLGFLGQFINPTSALSNTIGFASGGILDEPVYGFGMRSGRSYSFGESGSERVTPISRDYSSLYGSSSMQPIVVRIEGNFKADGRNLISAVKQGIVIDKKGGGRGF